MTMKRKFLSSIVIGACLISHSTQSFALAGFSRSCSLSELQQTYKLLPALQFFDAISNQLVGYYYGRYGTLSGNSLYGLFVLESLTTDYGSARYILYAEGKSYRLNPTNQVYEIIRHYKSNPLAKPEALKPSIYQNSTYSLIFKQGGLLPWSARAGTPEIIEQIYNPGFIIGGSSPSQPIIRVVGNHQYYDFSAGQWFSLPRSKASNCNLTEWGFEHR